MPIIYLIGARASGKTTVGKQLAKRLNMPFYDLDECLCAFADKNIAEIVAEGGWEHFRRLESDNLCRITAAACGNAVLATGGGIILSEENRIFMKTHGHVIWLKTPVADLHNRLSQTPLASQRPALTEKGLLEEIRGILAEREPLYEACANHTVNGAAESGEVCASIEACLLGAF